MINEDAKTTWARCAFFVIQPLINVLKNTAKHFGLTDTPCDWLFPVQELYGVL